MGQNGNVVIVRKLLHAHQKRHSYTCETKWKALVQEVVLTSLSWLLLWIVISHIAYILYTHVDV